MEKVMHRAIRYTINPTYPAVKTEMVEVSTTPLISEEKKSTKRYPLITITRAATSHETAYKK